MIPALVSDHGQVQLASLAEVPGAGWPDTVDMVEVVLVAAAVQPKDRQVARGEVPVALPDWFVLGTQAVVRDAREGALHYCRGPIGVRGGPQAGVFAGRFRAVVDWLIPLPPGLDPVLAAAGTGAVADASYALEDLAHLATGDTVLVLGSGTGVGAAAVSVALERGHQVIAATRDAAAIPPRPGLTVVGYDDLPAVVRTATGGHGADVTVDTVGGELTALGLGAAARRGRHVLLGYQAGKDLGLQARHLLATEASLIGMNSGAVDVVRRRELAADALGLLASGAHVPSPILTRPLAEGVEVLLGPESRGRTVLLGAAYQPQDQALVAGEGE